MRDHAIRIHHHGGPDVLRDEPIVVGDPGPDEVRVRHTQVGVNFIDTYHRSGLYPLPLPSGLRCLRPLGMMVSFGNASGPPPAVAPHRLAELGSLFLTRPTLATYSRARVDLVSMAEALFAVLASGVVRATIGQTFPLAEARRAHEALEARETHGATLLDPG